MAIDGFTMGIQDIKNKRMTMTIEVEDYAGYSNKNVAVISQYEVCKNFEKDGWDFHTFIPNEHLERKSMTDYSINFHTTNTTSTAYLPKGKDNMKTKIVEQAAGFVGTVLVVVDGTEIPVADTKAFKTHEKAVKAVNKLAVDVVKNGVSQ
jgi:hypothetical protein